MTSHAKDGWADREPPDAATDPVAAADDAFDPTASTDQEQDQGPDEVIDTGEGELFVDAEPLTSLADLPPPPHGAGGDLAAERDDYRNALLRVKADFENYKKRVAKDQAATVERAAEKLVADLLPVLDACEAALGHGAEDVEPIYKSLVDILEKGGLQRMDADGQPFDPNLHEAVMHEPDDDGAGDTIVTGSLRTGYLWNGRVVRPAMVKVKG